MTATQTSVDLIVVGSGAGGLTTAIAAADRGLTVLVLESSDRWGGSSSMSGGGLWLPNNPLMQREGVHDSREDALTYLEETIGDAGPATSRARKEAFVDNIAPFVQLCERHGMKWARSTNYPDYYPELPGGADRPGARSGTLRPPQDRHVVGQQPRPGRSSLADDDERLLADGPRMVNSGRIRAGRSRGWADSRDHRHRQEGHRDGTCIDGVDARSRAAPGRGVAPELPR